MQEVSPLTQSAIFSPHIIICLFTLLKIVLPGRKFYLYFYVVKFISVWLSYHFFIWFPTSRGKSQFASYSNFIISFFTFKPLIYIEFILVQSVRHRIDLIFFQMPTQLSQYHLINHWSFTHWSLMSSLWYYILLLSIDYGLLFNSFILPQKYFNIFFL